MQKILEKISNPLIFVFIAAILRLIPHAPNFAPIGAMALFGGAYLGKRYALFLPLFAMFLSDIFIGFDGVASRLTVYGSFILIGVIGLWLRERKSFKTVTVAAIGSSVLFFVITNFGVWLFGTMYPKSVEGLLACFTAAIPFFRNTLMGDLFYTGVLFGSFELVKNFVSKEKLSFIAAKKG